MGSDRLHLGLDIGGSSVKAAVLAADGRDVIGEGLYPIAPTRRVSDALEAVETAFADLRSRVGRFTAVGVGVPGMLDAASELPKLLPNFPAEWVDYPLRAEIERRLGLPVRLVNDAKAFSVAESLVGAGAGRRSVACVALGTGVGGGVVLDGRLWRGLGSAGEFGHLTVELDGPPCGCGNRGCVESMAGADAIAAAGGRPSALEVFAAAAVGDQQAEAALERAVRAIGAGLANVFITLAPEVFVVGGGLAGAGDQLITRIEREIRNRVTVAAPEQVNVEAARLGRSAGAVGAAILAATDDRSTEERTNRI